MSWATDSSLSDIALENIFLTQIYYQVNKVKFLGCDGNVMLFGQFLPMLVSMHVTQTRTAQVSKGYLCEEIRALQLYPYDKIRKKKKSNLLNLEVSSLL